MGKFITRDGRAKLIEDYSKTKLSLYEQQSVLLEVMQFLQRMSLTESGEKMRRILMKICKMRNTRISSKITELNGQIYQLQKQEGRTLE